MEKLKPGSSVENSAVIVTGAALTLGAGIDAAIHFHGGVSDPTMRNLVVEYFGEFVAKSSGNVIFAAAPTIIITATSKLLEHAQKPPWDKHVANKFIKHTALFSLAMLMAAGLLVEGFPNNHEFWPDVGAMLISMGCAAFLTDHLTHKLGQIRQKPVRNQADKLDYLRSTPTSVDQAFPANLRLL